MNEYELLAIPAAMLLLVLFVWCCDPEHEACRERKP